MFTNIKCHECGCQKSALSSFDENGELNGFSNYCLDHTSQNEREIFLGNLNRYISTHDVIKDLSCGGIFVDGTNLSNKQFFGCNFAHCTFSNLHASDVVLRLCIIDFSTFTDCDFCNSDIMYTSFAGTKFVHLIFTESMLVHDNFNGITSYQSSFDKSTLCNSSFVKSNLMNTSLNDCNLNGCIFYECRRENVSFKATNIKKEFFSRDNKGADMFEGEDGI